jgi:serine/threonine protein kinase
MPVTHATPPITLAVTVPRIVSTGDTVDGFTLSELLHEGGMARIYRAMHATLPGPFVIKVPKVDVTLAHAGYCGFETEMHVLTRLHGAHTPRVLGHGDMIHCPYLALEYLQDAPLPAAVARAPLPVQELIALAVPLCHAVHELHRHNVIHLDLKPENVRQRADGRVVLIDFGSAHHAHWPDAIDDVFVPAPFTSAYVAPEQLYHVRHDSRSDVYALGVVLYQLATGKLPFGRVHARQRLYRPPCPPRAMNPSVPPWLQEIILRCLAFHPNDRTGSAKKIAYALAHPNTVSVTALGRQTAPPGWWERGRYFFRTFHQRFDTLSNQSPRERVHEHAHVLVALDLHRNSPTLNTALRRAVARFARNEKHSTFTFLTAIEHSEGLPEAGSTNEAVAVDVQRQVELRHFAQPLKLGAHRMNFQVLHGTASKLILDYATQHAIDHVILGAHGHSPLRRYLGHVSARVAAEAPCSITVVRCRANAT